MLPVGNNLDLVGAARDLLTDHNGDAVVAAQATVHAVMGPDRRLQSVVTEPAATTATLLGLPVAGGFRGAV